MPKRTDIKKILIIGSGPIVIGQACEFDYSGTQACKALREEGYEIVLVNSNPATIMTDPELADRTYIEPLTTEFVAAIIKRERPDALLPTVGGQTALNIAVELAETGILDEYNVEMIGAKAKAVKMAEDRLLFKQAMADIGLATPRSGVVGDIREAMRVIQDIGFPAVIRPSFTLGGTGGGIAFNSEEFESIIQRGLDLSPVHTVLIEESVIGWKEFELEVMRDLQDNVVVICSIENFDPMGVHTGDSVTVAPAHTLTEIPNDITKKTPASFEPMLDYVVVKIPKWAFEKFPDSDPTLGTQMKSVGEVMAIGRTFKEAFLKGVRSLESSREPGTEKIDPDLIRQKLVTPTPDRIPYLLHAAGNGFSIAELVELTHIDPWFLNEMKEIADLIKQVSEHTIDTLPTDLLVEAKRSGFSDARVAGLVNAKPRDVAAKRGDYAIVPVYKRVDTCAAEFESYTPYFYSTYEEENEAEPSSRKKIIILGSGPNRIGQGIEFDYCCCHAAFALKEEGFETIMVNCNPETVSTDYDTSDRLYFEPLTLEDVLHIVREEKPNGVIVQFGGQTPLNLALDLQHAGVPIIGTSPESIDLAEDRKRFGDLLRRLDIPQPQNGTAVTLEEARAVARRIGYPVLVRPSSVLGGRAMVIVYDESSLDNYMSAAVQVSHERPILIDKFLEDAYEIDVDALCDDERVVIAGIMEHIEEAGVHSGDSSCVLPTYQLKEDLRETIRRYTVQLGRALNVIGLMNVQFAVRAGTVYVLEVNPRASRTVPFVSKATGVPLAKIAAKLMTGRKLQEFGLPSELRVSDFYVKSPVFPFARFQGVDTILGPEMKSTGEVMGVDDTFGKAYVKAQISAGSVLPKSGVAFISVNQHDKNFISRIVADLVEVGFKIIATRGTARVLRSSGIEVETVYKVNEGRPHIVDYIKSGKVDLIINTPLGRESFFDEKAIRRAAINHHVPCITTIPGAAAAVNGIRAIRRESLNVRSLQEYHSPPR